MARGIDRVKEYSEKKRNPNKWLRTRMWLSYLISLTGKDRGSIPANIGNNILISNNVYVTRKYLSSIIHVKELSINTPEAFLQDLTEHVRSKGSNAIIDFTLDCVKMSINLEESGYKSRRRTWESMLKNPHTSVKDAERAVRLLYTVDQVRNGNPLREVRMFITVRAETGTDLGRAEGIVLKYLKSIQGSSKRVTTNLPQILNYTSVISNTRDKELKYINSLVFTNKTLSQILPNTSSTNTDEGMFMGINVLNNTPFKLDTSKITSGRNLYIASPTGAGKTVLAKNMAASMLEQGYCVCVVDIKDYDYRGLVEPAGGVTISLSPKSTSYINTYRVRKENCKDEDYEVYFKGCVEFSKRQLVILSELTDKAELKLFEAFLGEYFEYLYLSLGIVHSNSNTWYKTDHLNPFTIYDTMIEFINDGVKNKYGSSLNTAITNLKQYLTKDGDKSFIFKDELVYSDILDTMVLDFNFDISKQTNLDLTIFKLKFEYMSRINNEYVLHHYKQGRKCFKILEEVQVIDDDLREMYIREFTLKRSLGQDTVLIGNSVSALTDNSKAKYLVENTKGLLVGGLSKTARVEVLKHFDMPVNPAILHEVCTDTQYTNSFLFINYMEKNPVIPIIKIDLDRDRNYMLFQNNGIEYK